MNAPIRANPYEGKVVVVSLEGVLVSDPMRSDPGVVARAMRVPQKRLQSVWDDLIGPALNAGKILESEAWKFLGNFASIEPAFARKAYLDAMHPNYYAIGAMHDLRTRGVRLILVDGYRSWIETLARRYPWISHFKEICYTSDYHAARHHSRFIEALRKTVGSDDFIFVDDCANVVHTLRARGIDAVLAKGLWMHEVWEILERDVSVRSRRKEPAAVPMSYAEFHAI